MQAVVDRLDAANQRWNEEHELKVYRAELVGGYLPGYYSAPDSCTVEVSDPSACDAEAAIEDAISYVPRFAGMRVHEVYEKDENATAFDEFFVVYDIHGNEMEVKE